ncbi:hypothetical protein BJ508DRAFT_333562 [Ascobolus immersus RN42]|uniref:F-box domain-containing protein n=1 Tax=Ascobolus immersus RN42 TaxID=1160509 RepID=A0A3N4HJ85_ASCIM|nr:hypothetical protein BJ508DRAFT_333562 [Ascobolus immersus RN42]
MSSVEIGKPATSSYPIDRERTANHRFVGTKDHSSLHPFLKLPVEMRLAIYQQCTILTLLILTHTCHQFYTEINSQGRIVPRSLGFRPFINTRPFTPHPTLPFGSVPLTLPMMMRWDQLEGVLEVDTFNNVYGRANYDPKSKWCCERCYRVKFTCEFTVDFSGNGREFLPYCSDCGVTV